MSRAQGRAGNDSYLARGFVAYDRAFPSKGMDVDPHHGGSATLEYALADCALAQMAAGLHEDAAATTLRARGRNWRNVWDAGVVDADTGFRGFPRPRVEDGAWYAPPRGDYSPRSQHGFHEGTAWQYSLDELSRFYERALALPADQQKPPLPPRSVAGLAEGFRARRDIQSANRRR